MPEFENDSIRETIVCSYYFIFRVDPGRVTIAAIVHVRQSFEAGVGRPGRA